jgi:hypothetical protein
MFEVSLTVSCYSEDKIAAKYLFLVLCFCENRLARATVEPYCIKFQRTDLLSY